FVALKADEFGVEDAGDGRGERRLADARLAFKKQRPGQADGEEERDGQTLVRHVRAIEQPRLQVGDRGWKRRRHRRRYYIAPPAGSCPLTAASSSYRAARP